MKLSKEALQKMIQEELEGLGEQTDLNVGLYGTAVKALVALYDNALEQGSGPREARKAMKDMFNDWLREYTRQT